MSDPKVKVWENRLRRMAQRQGLRLVASRRRDPRAIDYGTYLLVDVHTNEAVLGGHVPIYIQDVDKYLTER